MGPGFAKCTHFLVDTELSSPANSNNEPFLVYERQLLITLITQFVTKYPRVPCHDESTEQLIIPWRKGDLLHSSGFETHCCKEVERQVGKMLCFPQRSFLHYVMLLKIEAKLTRWAPSMGQACIHVPANSPWCGVTCREVTGVAAGGSLVESLKALGSMSVGQLLSEGSLMGWAALLFCLKTNLKAVQ